MTRLIHACLHTAALERLRCFYSETLAIPLADEREDGFSLRIGASVLAFRRGAAPPYHFAINIPSNLFDVARGLAGGARAASYGREVPARAAADAGWRRHDALARLGTRMLAIPRPQ